MPRPRLLKIPMADGVVDAEMYLNIDAIVTIAYSKDNKNDEYCYLMTTSGGVIKLPVKFYDIILSLCDFVKLNVPDVFYTSFGDDPPPPEHPHIEEVDVAETQNSDDNDDEDLTIPV